MLIVNTDHGLLLGEHGFWGKNYMPQYDEVVHTPLFIWDPRYGKAGETRTGLVQTIDLPASILEYFGLPLPPDMMGKPVAPLIAGQKPIREAALFGLHGAHACCTDGRYVYMKAPAENNGPLYNYTLMPTHMMWFFSPQEIKTMEKTEPFRFTKDMPLLRFEAQGSPAISRYGDLLFDLADDPGQTRPVKNNPAQEKIMRDILVSLMRENDAPPEQFARLGLN
jgi:hypothetical protein